MAEGRTLVEGLGLHIKHLVAAGKSLDAAAGAFNQAAGNLESRVLRAARRGSSPPGRMGSGRRLRQR